ncbi:glycosyltransferase family 39 protein [Actinopolyspora sp. BKK1]|nr:glycosyltransferase family 39 protein [Actinopolyspora sp. BKK2]NHE75383.1 glycosyltransferase family 39 protein [Actinopolyspora sp. BKK1]
MLRGGPNDPAWVRPALLALLALTALLYLWALNASGWANGFYSAAVQAGTQSWKAWLFGSSDASNAITVDKPPAALWLMVLSARILGFGSWSVLLPHALAGVATVGLLYATVRRCSGPTAGLIAGAVQALTPVAVLMFRFNNPDALLVLLLVAAAYCVVRATERAGPWWLVLAGVAIGFGFLTKMFQAFAVLPVFALVYLLAAPTTPWRRLWHLLAGGVAVTLSAGWYIALVELWPAGARPYIGGSQHNSLLELTFGYNGFGRLTGEETGGLGNTNSDAGWNRLLGSEMGDQIGWLIPAALIALAVGLWTTRKAPRTDLTRAGLLLWGGWLLLTGTMFSYANGIIHSYYTVALAPAVAALFGTGAKLLWDRRADPRARTTLAGTVVLTVVLAALLLARTPDWNPWLRFLIAGAGLGGAFLLLFADGLTRAVARTGAVLALVACLAAPTSYALATAATPHTGVLPSAGPSGSGGPGGGGGPGGAGGGAPAGAGGRGGGGATGPTSGTGGGPGGGMAGGMGGGAGGPSGGGGGGSPFSVQVAGDEVAETLRQDADSYTWVAAVTGSSNAAGYQLAAREPVMAIGGFNGTDPFPTLERFQELVTNGRIHYYVAGSIMGGRTGSTTDTTASRIESWVQRNYTATEVGEATLYDLTAGS